MNKTATTYKPKKIYNLATGFAFLALIFFLLTLPLLASGEVERQKLLALGGFWLIGILLTVIPFGFRLEVGRGYVRTYFLNYRLSDVNASHVETVEYGNLYRGGLGFGKGLNYRAIVNGRSKTYSIGERFYGKKAIEHAQRALEGKA